MLEDEWQSYLGSVSDWYLVRLAAHRMGGPHSLQRLIPIIPAASELVSAIEPLSALSKVETTRIGS